MASSHMDTPSSCHPLYKAGSPARELHRLNAQGRSPALPSTAALPVRCTCSRLSSACWRLTPNGALTRCGPMVDLCHGPHLPNTGYLKSSAVGAVNRAFWRADVKREPLQVRSQLCRPSWSSRCPSARLMAAQGCCERVCRPVLLSSLQHVAQRHQRDVCRRGHALVLCSVCME